MNNAPLLEVRDLYTCFDDRDEITRAVAGVSLTVKSGETLAIVGESGSGKSVMAMSILGLLNRHGYVARGEILFRGKNLVELSPAEMNRIRGNEIAMIFQEPMTSLNPVYTIGRQIREVFLLHRNVDPKEAETMTLEILRETKIPNPEETARMYPHQLSGGMRQRVMIGMALACRPCLLIADEPTTALDVTIQAQILKLMQEMKEKQGTAILFITHDLGVVKKVADRVAVMYCGQVVELMSAEKLFADKQTCLHPYTRGLMEATPKLSTPKGEPLKMIPGSIPDMDELPEGCRFSGRCPYAKERCRREMPPETEPEEGHRLRCFYPWVKEQSHE
ncbi:MAG: ABC transporter ATP-binding protein [Lachnospiraceae bacterium]|nr:ABC transporter ATP-binding protein [Lachnospiraceae bacterium]